MDKAKAVGALLFARHADRVAEVMQTTGHKEYTAKDYLAKVTIDAAAKTVGEGYDQRNKNKQEILYLHKLLATEVIANNVPIDASEYTNDFYKIGKMAFNYIESKLGKPIKDPLGNQIHFAPEKGKESKELIGCVNHLLGGKKESDNEEIVVTNSDRAKFIYLAEETIKNPLAILKQYNGNIAYVAYCRLTVGNNSKNSKDYCSVVIVSPKQDYRVVTSIINSNRNYGTNSGKRRNGAFSLMERTINKTISTLYLREDIKKKDTKKNSG